MNFKNVTMMVLAALAITACSHKGHHHSGASCCDGKKECAMDKKDCAHCKGEKEQEAKESK
ncbi:hypothetical protein D3C87_189520 [compost metagenome]